VFVVDTNVLVYAADRDSPFHLPCRTLLERSRHGPAAWYLSWNIAWEFLRVVTHPRVLRSPWAGQRAWEFVEALLASPSLAMLVPGERHAACVREVLGLVPHLSGNLFHDASTATLMREHGIRRIYTRDTDFHRFPFVEPLDPAAP